MYPYTVCVFLFQASRLFLQGKEIRRLRQELEGLRRVNNEEEIEGLIVDDNEEELRRQTRGPKRKAWQVLGPRAKRRASDTCQKEILATAASRETDPVTIASHCLYR